MLNLGNVLPRQRKFSRRIRVYKEDYISVSIYMNSDESGKIFYDTVIHRKIKSQQGFEWKRGTNYKPKDLCILVRLLSEADEFLARETERSSV